MWGDLYPHPTLLFSTFATERKDEGGQTEQLWAHEEDDHSDPVGPVQVDG